MNAQATLFDWATAAFCACGGKAGPSGLCNECFLASREHVGPVPFGVARYPSVPGHKRRATSRSAAAAIAPRCRQLRDRALAVLRGSDATADECASAMRESVLAVRPRLTELFRLGQIEDTGLTRRNASGRPATVWRACA